MSKCASESCCLYLRGDLYLRDVVDACGQTVAAPKPFEKVGELSAFGYTPNITTIGGQKSLSLAGGTGCVTQTFDGLTVSMDVRCASNSNLAIALFGDYKQLAASTRTESIDGSLVAPGALVPFQYAGAKNVTIVSPTGAVVNVDYRVTPAGLEILPGTGLLTAGTDIDVSYSYGIQDRLEVGTRNSVQKELLFNGKDQNGNAVVIRLYKVNLGIDGAIEWLNQDDFVTFTLSGTALVYDDAEPVEFAPGLPRSLFGFIQRVQG